MAGYLKHGILHFRGATILLEIHPFFPEPNEHGRKGVKHQSNNNMEEKISSSIKENWKKNSPTPHSAKNVSHSDCFFFLSGLIFLYAMICSFQSWVSFSQWFLCHGLFGLSSWNLMKASYFLSLQDLTSQMILPGKLRWLVQLHFLLKESLLKSGHSLVSFQGCRSSTLSSSPKPSGNENDFCIPKIPQKSDDTVDGNQKSVCKTHQLIW